MSSEMFLAICPTLKLAVSGRVGGGSAHCVLVSPATGHGLVLHSVTLVYVSNLSNKWIVRIWVRKQGTYRKQNLQFFTKF